MKKDKENKLVRFNKPLFDYIKDVEGEKHDGVYMNVLKEIEDKFDPKYYFSMYKENEKRSVVSAYADTVIDANTNEYTSFRVSDHFPIIDNIFLKFPLGYPSPKEFAHICIMLFGYEEWFNLETVKRGFYALSKDDSKIHIETEDDYNRIKNFYKHNSSIPYHIYHYIPALLSNNDIDEIVKASEKWIDDKGNNAYQWPVPEKPEARPMSQPIEAKMVFVFNQNIQSKLVREDLSNVFVEGGSAPLARFHIRDIRYISPDKSKYFRISVYFDITSCEANVISLIYKFQNLFKLSEPKKVYLRKNKNKRPPKK